ncbi:MAG: DUF4169 family protein [Pseudomonadota bacterium]
MADPVNLRQFRKRKQRELKEQQAQANREQHGISKQSRNQANQIQELTLKKLSGKKRTPIEEK